VAVTYWIEHRIEQAVKSAKQKVKAATKKGKRQQRNIKNLRRKTFETNEENSMPRCNLLPFHISIELKFLLNLKVFFKIPVAQKDDEGKCNR